MSEPEPYEDRLIGVDCYNCPVGTYERGTATETHALEDLTLPISRMVSSRGILRRC